MVVFKVMDLDLEFGLCLWWEYFECIGYDLKLYDMFINVKKGG